MRAHLAYLRYLICHKWFVFWECVRLGIPWHGLVHDWHKFLPSEWFPYAHHFYNPDGTQRQIRDETEDPRFDYAWLLHQKRGKHHWQFWILPEDEGGLKILPMPDVYRREMLADWRGAGKAQGKLNTHEWYLAHKDKMQLHPETREWIEVRIL